MNSRALNCIKLHKFWHYLTNLGTNTYDRDQIVYQFFIGIQSLFVLNPFELHRLVSNHMNTAVT